MTNTNPQTPLYEQVEAYKRIFQESSEIRLMLEPEIAKKLRNVR